MDNWKMSKSLVLSYLNLDGFLYLDNSIPFIFLILCFLTDFYSKSTLKKIKQNCEVPVALENYPVIVCLKKFRILTSPGRQVISI